MLPRISILVMISMITACSNVPKSTETATTIKATTKTPAPKKVAVIEIAPNKITPKPVKKAAVSVTRKTRQQRATRITRTTRAAVIAKTKALRERQGRLREAAAQVRANAIATTLRENKPKAQVRANAIATTLRENKPKAVIVKTATVVPKVEKKKKPAVYVVKSGDNVYDIMKKTSVDWGLIAKLNNLKTPYIIIPGQRLKLK